MGFCIIKDIKDMQSHSSYCAANTIVAVTHFERKNIKYNKIVRSSSVILAYCEDCDLYNRLRIGCRITVHSAPSISKRKCWKIVDCKSYGNMK